MKIKISDLETLTEKALLKQGYSDSESEIIKKVLLYAQLRGNNQGVVKLIGKGIPRREAIGTPKIVKETPVSHLGGGSCGHLGIVIKKLRITQKSGRNFFEVTPAGLEVFGNFC